jgi:hypothetical protein
MAIKSTFMVYQYKCIKVDRFPFWARVQAINFFENTGFWKCPQRLARFFQKLMLSVDMIKSLPSFSMMDVEDQVAYDLSLIIYFSNELP